jgi:hypothetical protein
MAEAPERLPLLEFVLTELWARRGGSVMTHEAYRAIGGIEGAIAAYANTAFEALPIRDRDAARRVLLQLVRLPSEEPIGVQKGDPDEPQALALLNVATRRRATIEELGPQNRTVVHQLANAHLVVTARDASGRESADLVHEALIQQWGMLRTWVVDNHQFLIWRERIRTFRQVTGGGKSETWLRGAMLAEARRWRASRVAELSPSELAFISASTRAGRVRAASLAIASAAAVVALSLIPGVRETLWGETSPPIGDASDRSGLQSAAPASPPGSAITPAEFNIYIRSDVGEVDLSVDGKPIERFGAAEPRATTIRVSGGVHTLAATDSKGSRWTSVVIADRQTPNPMWIIGR